uniref:Uncharacterized protein n=1 Tax=Manihot esculenta TaxID=3983 RepID=A0A2C9V6T9_MANES
MAENDPLQAHGPKESLAVNHALIVRPCFIFQTVVPVSFVLKDTEVRSYRTDPVQVRSCTRFLTSAIRWAASFFQPFDVGL